jgi:SAM-dependent methyltransferase
MKLLLDNGIKNVVGIDKSPIMIEKANSLYNDYGYERVLIKLERGEKMFFEDNCFDLVVCMRNTFGNLEENLTTLARNQIKMKVLDEMIRVLKPGGTMLLSLYKDTTKALEIRKKSYLEVKLTPYILPDNKTIHTKEGLISEQFDENQIIDWIEQKGLKSIKVFPINEIAFCLKATKS